MLMVYRLFDKKGGMEYIVLGPSVNLKFDSQKFKYLHNDKKKDRESSSTVHCEQSKSM